MSPQENSVRGGVKLRVLVALVAMLLLGAIAGPAAALADGSISGTVSAAAGGAPIEAAEVCAEGLDESDYECAETGADGTYAIADLEAGDYTVEFWPPFGSNYIREFWNGKLTWGQADEVTVTDGADTPGINASLELGGWIEGRVTSAATKNGVGEVTVCAYPIDEEGTGRCGFSEPDGTYAIRGLDTDSYEVGFYPEEVGGDFLIQYYHGKANWFEATPVAVTIGAGTAGIDAELQAGGRITGTVTDSISGAGIRLGLVCLREAVEGELLGCVYTNGSGQYTLAGLPPGSYKVWFSPDVPEWEEEDDYFQQYYSDKPSFTQANAVTVVPPGTVAGVDARLVSRKAQPPTPAPTTTTGTPTIVSRPPVKAVPLRCPKGKRVKKVKGKKRCVKVQRKRHHRRHHAKRDLFHVIGDPPRPPLR